MAFEEAQHEAPAQQSALQSKELFFSSLFISSAPALGFQEKEIGKERKNKTTTPSQKADNITQLSEADTDCGVFWFVSCLTTQ